MTAPGYPVSAEYRVIGVAGIPIVQEGNDLAALVFDAAAAQGSALEDGDALIVTQRIVSKAEGRVRPLDEFEPSAFARDYAERLDKDPGWWRWCCGNRPASCARWAAC